ncbi:MAG: nucleotidyltransferase family protein [Chloroflexi bacterium]|nr:nucleotidyltransferase family protein [Chloroflexota bacterium]
MAWPDSRGLVPYHLLALCARASGHDALYAELAHQLADFDDWQELISQAEVHGMAPLLWHHIQQSGAEIPSDVTRTLKGLYLRHHRNNQIHAQVLLEILALLQPADIHPLVLKGLGLAYSIYPEPALRPISDLDLLLQRDELRPALELLHAAGFSTPSLPHDDGPAPKELTVDSPARDGLRVHVELHHYDPRARDDEFAGFDSPPQAIQIEGGMVLIPAPMDTLAYLSRHFTRHLFEARTDKPLKLKWSADLLSLVECRTLSIDWSQQTKLLQRLDVFYSLTPLPESLRSAIPIARSPIPAGVNQYPQGWPQEKFERSRQVGLGRFVAQTFRPPSEWWLRLYYGIRRGSRAWYGQVAHRARVLRLLLGLPIRKII